jgi:hypothetical protein
MKKPPILARRGLFFNWKFDDKDYDDDDAIGNTFGTDRRSDDGSHPEQKEQQAGA